MPSPAVSTAPTQASHLTSLIAHMAQGDESALTAFYDATSAAVYGLALRIVHDPSVAEEVVLEVYVQAYRQAASYDPCRGMPAAWLLTLTRSRALDRRRHETTYQHHETPLEYAATMPATTPTPEEYSMLNDMRRVVCRALMALRPEQRQVLEIAYYEGLSHAQIATRLGQPLGTIKTRLRLGMQALRQTLLAYGSSSGQGAALRNSKTSSMQASARKAMSMKQS